MQCAACSVQGAAGNVQRAACSDCACAERHDCTGAGQELNTCAGDNENVPAEGGQDERVQPQVLNQLLATVKVLEDKVANQQIEIEAQKDVVEKQREDTTRLHVNSYIHKTQQRELEMKAEMDKYADPR